MTSEVDPLPKLLRGVRKRMTRARHARAVVIATFAVAATIFVFAILGRSFVVTLAISTVVFVGVFLALAIRRSPDEHAIAAHIDHDRNLHELLASSLSTGDATDAASVSLRAMANDAVARLRSEDVRVAALSSRWAIAAMLVFGASMIVSALIAPQALHSPVAGGAAGRSLSRESMTSEAKTSRSEDAPAAAAESGTKNSNAIKSPTRSPSGNDASKSATESRADAGEPKTNRSDTGSARGQTADASHAQLALDQPKESSTTPGERSSTSASTSASTSTSGRGRVGEPASSSDQASNGESNGANVERAPITASSAAIDATAHESVRATVSAALSAGSVPVRCRDLVRAYFDIDASASASGGK